MTYDLLIKNGRVIDGSGRPAFHGDVGVSKGKIVELGRLSGSARQTIEADGRVVSPGFVDNHLRALGWAVVRLDVFRTLGLPHRSASR